MHPPVPIVSLESYERLLRELAQQVLAVSRRRLDPIAPIRRILTSTLLTHTS